MLDVFVVLEPPASFVSLRSLELAVPFVAPASPSLVLVELALSLDAEVLGPPSFELPLDVAAPDVGTDVGPTCVCVAVDVSPRVSSECDVVAPLVFAPADELALGAALESFTSLDSRLLTSSLDSSLDDVSVADPDPSEQPTANPKHKRPNRAAPPLMRACRLT